MVLSNTNIGFIGGGNMAQALISGLLSGGVSSGQIMVSDPNEAMRDILSRKGVKTTISSDELIKFSDVVIVAIKPQMFTSVLQPLNGKFDNKLIISIAAGVSIAEIQTLTGSLNIVRSMPNTPALIGEGATGVYANEISSDNKNIVNDILSSAGLVVWVEDELQIHAVTAVSGSAPAYFFYMLELIIESGQKLGLSAEQAQQLALQTAFGASKMALTSKESPAVLREQVTSPNGTTNAAIKSMKEHDLEKVVFNAMNACVDRSIEMSENNK